MIEWRKYKETENLIERYTPYLITDGREIMMAELANQGSGKGYGWRLCFEGEGTPGWISIVTHYAVINLPGEEEA